MTGSFKTKSDQSEYTPLAWDQAHEEAHEEIDELKGLHRDPSYEEIEEEGRDQVYEVISDEQTYEETTYVELYEDSINTTTKAKEDCYEKPDDAVDQSLSDPIYIVPDPKEQNKKDHHLSAKNISISCEHNVSTH